MACMFTNTFKRTMVLILAVMLIGFETVAPAYASGLSTTSAEPLVALGDSVTFGFNMADTNENSIPSRLAFPGLIGQSDGFSVSNLGVPGWETDDLLHALQTPDFVRALYSASVVTLDVGINDLLHVATDAGLFRLALLSEPATLTSEEEQALTDGASKIGQNLNSIVKEIRTRTDAPIVFYNLYNPFPDTSGLHAPTEQFEQLINQSIENISGSTPDVLYVDVHQAFDHHQLTYVRVAQGDFHPTVLGQQVLATLGESALSTLQATLKGKTDTQVAQMAGEIQTTGGTVSTHLFGHSITLNVPPGALNVESEVDVTCTNPTGLTAIVPGDERVVAESSVHWMTGVKLSKPYSMTIQNPDIPPGSAVYQIEGNKFSLVPSAKIKQGEAVISSTTEGDFVVVVPTVMVVPEVTKPEIGSPVLKDGILASIFVGCGGIFMYVSRQKRKV